ncbi:MAG: IPT/TIG domain-containing protein [Kofleriaceae bacterium]
MLAVALVLAGCADDAGPRLDAVTPAGAIRGGMVTLTGRRLCGAQGDCARAAGEVQVGLALPTVRAVVVSYSDTSAQIVIPDLAPVGPTTLVVTVNERSSNAVDFEVVPVGIP